MQKQENNQLQSFLWDGNTVGLLDGDFCHYYFQDEMGSPIRLKDNHGNLVGSFAYQEFGKELCGGACEKKNRQPFGFTGYQNDRIAGSYYAQAREYLPTIGRFSGRDIMKGFVAVPMTLNEYGYCWGNPLGYIDKNGLWPEWIEITGKVVTGIGLGLSVAALGMASAPAVAIAAGIVAATSLAGVIGGYMNEANGGSYLNGYAGAATGAAVQSGAMFLGGAPGCIVGGAASAWISSKMTDELDNADPTNSKYKTEEEINQSVKKIWLLEEFLVLYQRL